QVRRERHAHAAETLAIFVGRLVRHADPARARSRDAEIADHRDIGLAAGARRRRMRLALDLLPGANRRLDDPAFRVGGWARKRGRHVPLELDLGMTREDVGDGFLELRFDLGGWGARVATYVEIDFGRG